MINDIIELINGSSKIALSFHISPDGDSTGSSLALMQGLRSIGKEVYIVSKEATPKSLGFLPFSSEIDGNQSTIKQGTDLFIILDCGNSERVNTETDLNNIGCTLVNIDHHLSNELYGDYNFVDPKAAAMGEIVFKILKEMNISITNDIAKCIYTSLLTDTGSFRHLNTTKITHNIAGELIENGLDFGEIHRMIFDNKEFSRIKLLGKAIEGMYLAHNGKTCVIILTKKIFEELGIEDSDTSDIVSIGLKISSAEACILVKEADSGVKVSLRSKSTLDVRNVAEVFGGGGHIRASGAFVGLPLEQAIEKILGAIENEMLS